MEKKSAMNIFMEQQAASPEEESLDMDDSILANEEIVQAESNIPFEQLRKASAPRQKSKPIPFNSIKTSEELQLEKEQIRVRVTGFWFWRRVIVPPNVYVIHTRINKKNPVTLGLGYSFRYKPNKDAYQVIPSSMQTIGVVANCISKEKQGINILAYLQWQIDDISIAYRKLDFSDSRDPLAIVNAQLREQAEAAIKDKIATMSVEEVLTDKAPIIQELTTRLKAVSEEREKGGEKYEGLGINIITVQIREAIVCSQSLWKDLQSPFRYEKTKTARLSFLATEEEIKRKELETQKQIETNQAETNMEIRRIKEQKETEAIEYQLKEDEIRFKKQQESKQGKLQMEEKTTLAQFETRERLQTQENKLKLDKELEMSRNAAKKQAEEAKILLQAETSKITMEVERQLHQLNEETRLTLQQLENTRKQLMEEKSVRVMEAEFQQLLQDQQDALANITLQAQLQRDKWNGEYQLELAARKNQVEMQYEAEKVKIERIRQEVRNLINDKELFHKLISELPSIASSLPAIDELKIIQTGEGKFGMDALVNFVTKIFTIADSLGIKIPGVGTMAATGKE